MTRYGDGLDRLLLRIFPAPFRRRHSAEMLAHFRAQRQSLRGRPVALAALWVRGLFSAMASEVSQRSHEIGIRMALGAPAWRVLVQIGRHGAATVAAGTTVGLLLAGAATGWAISCIRRHRTIQPCL